jgi:Transglutaminase-like superfamily
MIKKVKSFSTASREVKVLFLKAYFLSALVRFSLVFLSFRKILDWQGQVNVESPNTTDEASLGFRKSLQSAIRLCDKYTLWSTECYTRALTGKILLRQYGLPGTIYIGFTKKSNGSYAGHAWLRSFDRIITGGEEMYQFTVHSFYS